MRQSFFRRRIRGADRAGGADQQKAGGHVARDFFGEALGFLRALLREQVQPRQFLFLRAQFFDHALHGRGHEGRSVFGAGLGFRPIFLLLCGRRCAEIFG